MKSELLQIMTATMKEEKDLNMEEDWVWGAI